MEVSFFDGKPRLLSSMKAPVFDGRLTRQASAWTRRFPLARLTKSALVGRDVIFLPALT